MPPSSASSAAAGSSGSPSPNLPQAGRPHSLQPGDAGSSAVGFAVPEAASAADAPAAEEQVREEALRPKVNQRLSPAEVQALCADDFLLGTDLSVKCPPEKSQASAMDETFAQLDVALKHREYNVAEALWKRMVSVGAAAVIPDRPELRAIASRYVSAMCPRIQDELESAIDRKDVWAAEREHQRLSDLRDTYKETRMDGPDVALDRMGRTADLEARYQQLCDKNSLVMCNLFPRVSVSSCLNQNGCSRVGQDPCTVL